MNNFLNKLERRYGKYAISNLTLYLIICYAIGYVLYMMTNISGLNIINAITFNPQMILRGQIWRIVSWVLIPPSSLGIFTIIMLFFYYSIGTNLERVWGTFRYNVYIFSGMLFTFVFMMIFYAVAVIVFKQEPVLMGQIIGSRVSTYYINLSIFLAFAASFPDMQLLLYFIIPIKIKWLAILDLVVIIYDFIASGSSYPQIGWTNRVVIIASLLNFAMFFFGSRNYSYVSPKEVHRRQAFKQQVKKTTTISKHKCAICGRTEKDDETLDFRFCSKCNGNYEYCNNHLFTHEHIK